MARNKFLVVVSMMAVLVSAPAWSATASAQSGGQFVTPHSSKHRLKPAPPGTGFKQVALLRMLPPKGVETDTYYWLVVARNDHARNSPPSELRFMVGPAEPKTTIYIDHDSDYFLYALFPNGDDSSVVATLWGGGTGLHTRIYGISRNHVTLLMDRGTHLPPEFTLGAVLLNTGWVPVDGRCCTASRTEIWTWTGQKYKLAATVAFDQRFAALRRLRHTGAELPSQRTRAKGHE